MFILSSLRIAFMASACCRTLLFRRSTGVHHSMRYDTVYSFSIHKYMEHFRYFSSAPSSSSKSRYLEVDGMRLPYRKLKQSVDADLMYVNEMRTMTNLLLPFQHFARWTGTPDETEYRQSHPRRKKIDLWCDLCKNASGNSSIHRVRGVFVCRMNW